MWPSMMTQTLNVCSAFNPSKGTHTAVNTHPEQWPAIYLCSIINKILAHMIRKSFSFNLIQIKKRPNISGIRVVLVSIHLQ